MRVPLVSSGANVKKTLGVPLNRVILYKRETDAFRAAVYGISLLHKVMKGLMLLRIALDSVSLG